MFVSALDMATRPDLVSCSAYIDDVDLATAKAIESLGLPRVSLKIGPRILLSAAWNEAQSVAPGPIFMHCGDDVVFRTQSWDSLVRDAFSAFPDRIVFIYGRDGYQDMALGTHGFLHDRWVKTLGYFVPPYFSSDYNDTWLNEVANLIGRRHYVPELFIEHMHYMVGKGPLDEVHQERIERGRRDNVAQVFASLAAERISDAQKLQRHLKQLKS